PLRFIDSVQEDHSEGLVELSNQAVEQDGADVIILAGAPLTGLDRNLKGELPVPVVDGVSSAVCHCESLINLDPGIAVNSSFAKPPIKPNNGLTPELAMILNRTH